MKKWQLKFVMFLGGILLYLSLAGSLQAAEILMYRLYNPNSGEHFYTKNSVERLTLAQSGWYSADSQQIPLYRSYNCNAKAGSHHYTTSLAEHQALLQKGWQDEKIGWYALKAGQSVELTGWARPINQTNFDSRQIGLACLQFVNQERQQKGLAPLKWNEQAFQIADLRA